MGKSLDGSILLIMFGLPVAILAATLAAIAAATFVLGLLSPCLTVVPLPLGLLAFVYVIKQGLSKREIANGEAVYVTDWRGNSDLRYGFPPMLFRDKFFTFKNYSPLSRETTQERQVGLSKLRLTVEWRPNPKYIDRFMNGAEVHKEIYLVTKFAEELAAKHGENWLCPEGVDEWAEIHDDTCGVIITHRFAERAEPLVDPNSEDWMEHDDIQIGVKDDEPVLLTDEDRLAHIQIIGASRYGKSKLIEYVARQIIYRNQEGLCVIDPNQHLYDDLLTWCVHRGYSNYIFFLDPSDERSTIGFNPFLLRGKATPERIAARANRMLRTTLKAFGISGDSAVQAQRIIRCLYYVLIEQNLPVTELKAFFTPRLFDRRDEIMSRCQSEDIRDQWKMLTVGKKVDSYVSMMQSSANRLFEFISEGGVQRIFTNPHALDFADISEKKHVVIINLGKSDVLPAPARNVLGTFLVDEIWDVMSRRKREQIEKLPHFNLMVDEFQNFATPDFAEMLKEGAKTRLHLWLINHVLSDLDRDVKNALKACHTRIAFGGTMQQDAAFVLEGGTAREGYELRNDVELVPRLAKRQFMLWRLGARNSLCETAEVKTFSLREPLKELYLEVYARQPDKRKDQTKNQEPIAAIIKTDKELSQIPKMKKEEVPPDEFYY